MTNAEDQARWRIRHKTYVAYLEATIQAKDAELVRLRSKIEEIDEFRRLFKQLMRRIDESN